jgi:hypothetical protein
MSDASIVEELRERLERIEAERTHAFIRIRTDELRELLDELDALDDQVTGLLRANQEAAKDA